MITTAMTNGLAFSLLLAAASLAAASIHCNQPSFGGWISGSAVEAPAWLPWVVVAALAVASIVFGVLRPDVFGTAMNEGFAAP
ncbi:MAG TPA: hypothetical protein VME41_17385 [Stellaceae bacterium]|nr:hypothetical protein [Stellaceae bacterium]